MKTIGIVGTRRKDTLADMKKVEEKFLELYEKGDTICSGKCYKGADRFAVVLSERYRTPAVWYPADWKKYGRSAGFLRNSDIALESNVLIALCADDRTGGTEDTVRKFIKFHGDKNLHILL